MQIENKIYLFGLIFDSENSVKNINHEEGEDIEFTLFNDISAAVSTFVPIVDLETSNKKIVGELLIRHQKTLEKIMSENKTVLPVKLGTYFNSKSEIQDFLKNNYDYIKSIEPKIIDKIEVDVVATWANFSEVITKVSLNSKIKELKEKLINKPEGVTIQDQQQLGFLIAGIIKENNKTIAEKCFLFMKNHFLEIKKHDVMNDEMIFNTSFLIEKKKLSSFNEAIDVLDKNFEGKLNFRYVGPLPCYSFFTLEAIYIDHTKLKDAQRILTLKDTANLAQVKKAYREKAVINHPDKKGENKTNIEFEQINKAYKTLIDYFSSVKAIQSDFEKIEFNKINEENGKILAKLKE